MRCTPVGDHINQFDFLNWSAEVFDVTVSTDEDCWFAPCKKKILFIKQK